jgi:hypothetical protein
MNMPPMSTREERLDRYGWTIRKSARVVPGSNPDDAPEGMVEETLLIFESIPPMHRVIIGLDDDNRRKLVQGLSHGIIVA